MNNVLRLKFPEPPKQVWYIRIDGGAPSEPGFYWMLPGKPPKAVHQWMMRLVFGWRVTNKIENE